ncbi:MAG: WG repeat-containing protein [Muribaculaceae bacterium]|nr:WG repeat-containing protein [Muribaculaceae bacterium]
MQAQELFTFKDTNGLYGYKDNSGQQVIPPKYEDAWSFSDGLAAVMLNGKWGYIDKKGELVIPTKYDSPGRFHEGLAIVKINGKRGYIDNKGVFVIPPKYDEIESFQEGLAAVKINDKWGYYDNKGKFVIKPIYELTWKFSEGLAAVKINGKWGYIDKKGEFVIQPKYEETYSFHEGLAMVKINGKRGYIDNKGVFVIPPKYDEIESFQEGLAAVKINDKWGYYDNKGKFVIKPIYELTWKFSEGLAAVKINGKWGYIDKKGEFFISPKYESASDFSEDLAGAMIDGKCGYIDKKGEFVIPPKYDDVYNFKNGVAKVQLNNSTYWIDRCGNEYEDLIYYVANFHKSFPDFINSNVGSYDSYLTSKGIVPLTKETLAAQVQVEVERWQEKDEFESTADWQKRVNESTRTAKAREVADRISNEYNSKVKRVQDEYKEIYNRLANEYCDYKAATFARQEMALKPYDADNQTFLISTSTAGDILLPVPLSQARDFKNNWESIKASVKAEFVPGGHDVALKSVRFGDFVYDSNTRADYALTDVEYNFRPLDLSDMDYKFAPIASAEGVVTGVSVGAESSITPQTVTLERRRVQGGTLADVDMDIPEGSNKNDNIFAVIIANSNYAKASTVVNAENDGTMFAQYLTKTIGVPESQLKVYHDATYGTMASAMAYLGDVARAYRNEPFNVIFYYVGHGLPDDDSKEAYLLPVDIDPRITRACYPLKQLYKELSELDAANVTVFIDACFSGSNHGDGMLLADARGVAIKAKDITPGGKMVVMTASQAGQTAFPYKEKGHGLFTYYILKKLKESRGKVTLGELSDYVTDQVSKISIKVNSKPQNPTVATSPSLTGIWRTIPFGGK